MDTVTNQEESPLACDGLEGSFNKPVEDIYSTDSDDFYNATVRPHLLSEGAKPLGGKQPRNVIE